MYFVEDIILNIILMMFPILVFFIYNCYREVCMEKYSNLILDVSLVTSMYLCFRYGNIDRNSLGLLISSLKSLLFARITAKNITIKTVTIIK